MPALENAEIAETTYIPAPKACPTMGCSCRDARIVSIRRVAFYAAVARSSGQTADRIIPADPEWPIPAAEPLASTGTPDDHACGPQLCNGSPDDAPA